MCQLCGTHCTGASSHVQKHITCGICWPHTDHLLRGADCFLIVKKTKYKTRTYRSELVTCDMYKMVILMGILDCSKGWMISQNSPLPTFVSLFFFPPMSTPVWPLLIVTSLSCQVLSCWVLEATSIHALLWSLTCFHSGMLVVWRLHSISNVVEYIIMLMSSISEMRARPGQVRVDISPTIFTRACQWDPHRDQPTALVLLGTSEVVVPL